MSKCQLRYENVLSLAVLSIEAYTFVYCIYNDQSAKMWHNLHPAKKKFTIFYIYVPHTNRLVNVFKVE